MVMGSSDKSHGFNFAILLKLRKSDAHKIYVFYRKSTTREWHREVDYRSSGMVSEGNVRSMKLIQKLAHAAWYCLPPYDSFGSGQSIASSSSLSLAGCQSTSSRHRPHVRCLDSTSSACSTADVRSNARLVAYTHTTKSSPILVTERWARSWSRCTLYRQSAHRWLCKSSPAVGCYYFLPGLRSPTQLKNVTILWPVPSYTARWQRHIGLNNLTKADTQLPQWESNPGPNDSKSNAQLLSHCATAMP